MNTSTQQHAKPATQGPGAQKIAMKFEVAAIPVADVDRSKRFYSNLGWRLDADFVVGDNFRVSSHLPVRRPRFTLAKESLRPRPAPHKGCSSSYPTSRRLAPNLLPTAPTWGRFST